MKKGIIIFIVALIALWAITSIRNPARFFEAITGVSLPSDAKLIFQRIDTTERAYVWECPGDISHFTLPADLSFEPGYENWNEPWFGYVGELKKGDFFPSMKFQIVRTGLETFAIGKDTERRQIALSWIDTN